MMSLLLSSVSASAITAGAPPVAVDPFISARYWRVDNIVRESSATVINGMSFNTYNRVFANNLYHTPVSITTNLGDQTATFDRLKVNGRGGTGLTNIDTITYFEFDYGVPITPNNFSVYAYEIDVDYISTADISYSNDGTTWTKCGEFSHTGQRYTPSWADYTEVRTDAIWTPNVVAIEDAMINLVIGGIDHGVVVQDSRILVLSGRMPGHIIAENAHLYVLTEPS